jgi:nicotinamidase-related amidase
MRRDDGVVNRLHDNFFRANAGRGMARQLIYPADTTALVIVDCQHDLVEPATTAGWSVLFTCHVPQDMDQPTPYHRLILDNGPCQPGTLGAMTVAELRQPEHDDLREIPHTGVSSFVGSDLESRLRGHGIERVVVAGAFTDIGVDSTARDTAELGFHTRPDGSRRHDCRRAPRQRLQLSSYVGALNRTRGTR